MLGWINDCIEKLVIAKYGVDAWHNVKEIAKCEVKDGAFFKLECYSDQSTLDLVAAASEVSGLSVDEVLEAFGDFWIDYIIPQGYDSLLRCQGRTFKDFLTNINVMHEHLQATFPKKMTMPQFWCEDCPTNDDSLMLHYYSERGSLLTPLAMGIVSKVASFQYDVEIVMTKLKTQGVLGAKATCWRITAKNPEEQWKLKHGVCKRATDEETHNTTGKCPFTGMMTSFQTSSNGSQPSNDDVKVLKRVDTEVTFTTCDETSNSSFQENSEPVGLSGELTKSLFPYHVVMDYNFEILQVGDNLPGVLSTSERSLVGEDISDVFEITKPMDADFTWRWLRKMQSQTFELEPIDNWADQTSILKFKGSIVHISKDPVRIMLIMNPDANNLDELRDMKLTLSDLPVHGAYRDTVFLREHLSTQMNNAMRMEKLTKSLELEKNLLESLIPEHAAEGLRLGKTVEPMMHKNVTMFFSDIVGFTSICKQINPGQIIDMLNRLYRAMDYLAKKFHLYKVETIGDAYVCCSGLPGPDENHAENVANFAIAVTYCCKQILSPVNNKDPIQLRIGIHSGECASGIVGTTSPRYCVFGDTVNTTARHESTGKAGEIHCSRVTQSILQKRSPSSFKFVSRGTVEMKGKGRQNTFWLYGSEKNELTNQNALEKLNTEVQRLLGKTDFPTSSQKSTMQHAPQQNDQMSPPQSQVRVEQKQFGKKQDKSARGSCPFQPYSKARARPASNRKQGERKFCPFNGKSPVASAQGMNLYFV